MTYLLQATHVFSFRWSITLGPQDQGLPPQGLKGSASTKGDSPEQPPMTLPLFSPILMTVFSLALATSPPTTSLPSIPKMLPYSFTVSTNAPTPKPPTPTPTPTPTPAATPMTPFTPSTIPDTVLMPPFVVVAQPTAISTSPQKPETPS